MKHSSTILIFTMVALTAVVAGVVTGLLLKSSNTSKSACTAEAKLCPDGSAVGRTGPQCEFAPCPTFPIIQPTQIVEFTVTPPTDPLEYTCPTTEYVNCMPSMTMRYRPECEEAYLKWAQINCPGFKGATY